MNISHLLMATGSIGSCTIKEGPYEIQNQPKNRNGSCTRRDQTYIKSRSKFSEKLPLPYPSEYLEINDRE